MEPGVGSEPTPAGTGKMPGGKPNAGRSAMCCHGPMCGVDCAH